MIDTSLNVNNINIITKVYPNPASNSLFFEINDPKAFSIKILDLSGKIVEQRKRINKKEEFQLNNYSNGLYLYQMLNRENKVIQSSQFNVLK